MYAEERQRTIVNLAMRFDRVAVTELAHRFGVTTETIRRDLDVLNRRGILRRVHGGAVPAENVRLVETAVAEREPAFSAQKARIGQAALAFLPSGDGSTVLIDSGTTTARFAAALGGGQKHTIVTSSVPIASQWAQLQNGPVHLLGGRVRWTMPYHLIALGAIVIGLDVMAANGPTLKMLGITQEHWPYFDSERQMAYSFVLNGLVFLGLMLAAERTASLDLRRGSKWLEVLAILHVISALFSNALQHRSDALVRYDVWVYLAFALCFATLAPWRSRWRMLVGGLMACGLGSYLLVDLELVARKPFIIGLGVAGLLGALGAFVYVRRGTHR